VAREARLSRATVYRYFPGGRDELNRSVIEWETARFFGRLAEAVIGTVGLAGVLEEGLLFAHRAVEEHEVLQKVLETEPERLLPALTTASDRIRGSVADFLVPYLEAEDLRDGIAASAAADFLSRMLLSFIGAQGRWDLTDRDQVRTLVRSELLAGILREL
jgi:AcrR family transcriptional regulator